MRYLCHCSSMFMGEGVVPSEGLCFSTLSRCRYCARGIRSVATWGKEVYTDLQKTGKRCTRSTCKRSLWCHFLSCRVLRSKSDISQGVPCCVSLRPFTGGRRRSNLVVKHSRSSVGQFNDPGSPLRAPARNTAMSTMACFREHV